MATVKDESTRLNVNVIETWVNETLSDAEHLDIPGVILKPDHKNPISRYNIDRITLNVTWSSNLFRNALFLLRRWIEFIGLSLYTALVSMKCSKEL